MWTYDAAAEAHLDLLQVSFPSIGEIEVDVEGRFISGETVLVENPNVDVVGVIDAPPFIPLDFFDMSLRPRPTS